MARKYIYTQLLNYIIKFYHQIIINSFIIIIFFILYLKCKIKFSNLYFTPFFE